MNSQELMELGAKARYSQLKSEMEELVGAYPALSQLNGHATPAPTRTAKGTNAVSVAVPGAVRARRKMSAIEKKAVSTRMKAYWAARRKATKK